MMKILLATPLYPPSIGGPATYSRIISNEFPGHGVGVSVVSFSDVRKYPWGIRHLFYLFKIFQHSRGTKLILALDAVSVGLPVRIAALILRKPVIVKIGGDYAWEQGVQRHGVNDSLDVFLQRNYGVQTQLLRYLQSWVARGATKIIVPSNYLKNVVTTWGVNKEIISVIYNSFSLDTVNATKEEIRKKRGLKGTILLSAGRLVPWKGFKTLIEVMPELKQYKPDINLYIAGSGPDKSILESTISHLDASTYVTLLGEVERKVLSEYIIASDIFILNSSYEGLSHQLLEVLGYGVTVIASRTGGNSEIIKDHENGLLIEVGDKETLLKTIKELIENPSQRDILGKAGKESLTKFSKELMINKTINLIHESI